MINIQVLVLNGSPGSGKSTIANAISEKLRESEIAHTVIDVDELGRVYPETHGEVMWANLADVFKNYALIDGIKVILPLCIDDEAALIKLREAVPCDSFTICELTAPIELLKNRVTDREPNEYWQQKLRKQVQDYSDRSHKFNDLQVDTELSTPEQTAQEIIERLSW